jgi:hypothetical protein
MHPHRDVLLLDTQHAQLPLAMREQYLVDLHAWVTDHCRAAARRGEGERFAMPVIDALCGPAAPPIGFARWRSIGPHASLRREFGLSDDAVAIMLLVAAPRMWGALTHVYASLVRSFSGIVVSQQLLATLLDSRTMVLSELACQAPLIRNGLVSIRGNGAIVASGTVVRRLGL